MTRAQTKGGVFLITGFDQVKTTKLENTKILRTEKVWGNTEFIENKHGRKNKITPNPWEKEKKKKIKVIKNGNRAQDDKFLLRRQLEVN